MSEKIPAGDALILVIMAALVAAWATGGVMDVSKRTEVGFITNGKHEISWLAPGGPAEQVNMRVGDRIIRIDGKDVEDTSAIVRLPRVAEGERRSYTVTREDRTIRYRPEFRTLAASEKALEHLSTTVGFSFLLIPLIACLTRPNAATRVLALMGLGISLSFFDGPYLVSYDVRAVATSVAQLFMLLGLAAMVHFLLLFPRQRPILKKSWGKKLVYLPMLIIWLLIAWRILFTPPAAAISSFISQFLSGVGITAYLLIGLFLLLRNYSRTDRDERSRLAFNRLLWATVFAIIPAVVAHLATMVSPDTPLPGQSYYFAALALIPMTWSLSASHYST
jgi:hypothetical protein